ncbi:cache domain-containing sensor histidine kinase [Lachnoanaerobaculum umeaense]|jgi:multi-sensor signal transduction histidine kinase|uniref:histidine kinase n=1 Tax=Lachnoanaerobaculum umeaense TaxID=617123 RepID=A0A385PYW1_9FIRM|nr:sensor histidine kinase [Lachnoanaerobaculum umeaense]AYA98574.1 sensor histidine kinase [Lachnoanaerobaculum umeaense]PZW97842.1 two-component system sensor histidine kinase YesM [Lachnoanaerobaculum umeaense]
MDKKKFSIKSLSIKNLSIQSSIFMYFTVTAIIAIALISLIMFQRFTNSLNATIIEENSGIIGQLGESIDSYLRNSMKISDSIYYNVIKNTDISGEDIKKGMNLIYVNNDNMIDDIALISGKGELIESMPALRLKDNSNVLESNFFKKSMAESEYIHFSMPHIRDLFDQNESSYSWVMSLSRAVEVTDEGRATQAVLLINLNYMFFEEMFSNVNLGNGGYIYLTNDEGDIIWHPRQNEIYSGRFKENNKYVSTLKDGITVENIGGKQLTLNVRTIGYTGWKLVGVTPSAALNIDGIKFRFFVLFVADLFLFLLAMINAFISNKISNPIKLLDGRVREIESGNLNVEIVPSGSYEVEHLGNSIKNMLSRIKVLMSDLVDEHNAKRKSEFDTLQSQINPHFLYNTLDIIVWMIENEKPDKAVSIVTALAKFFRISLSKGKNIITVKDEVEHVRNYLMIQNMRFKNRFEYSIDVEDDILSYSSLKLMLQPLVENAIYHGMEFMDGDGKIEVRVFKENDSLYFTISDNGLGMSEDVVATLLSKDIIPSKKGSGIGVKNVNERIKLYFGNEYGLKVESEPDEGTKITIHLPAIVYGEKDEDR